MQLGAPAGRIGQLADWQLLDAGLAAAEPVIYRDNGFRSSDGEALLAKLEQLGPALGISRIAELSQLSPLNYPVFQTTRPHIHTHPECGQNTGSQGKGRSLLQSKLSCLMEELESYCAEPRQCDLVRASYEQLKHRQLTVDPNQLTLCAGASVRPDEALMWLRGLRLGSPQAVLIPAEAILFPFFPENYQTASRFPCSSNGLAAGASYLEAVIHGLYEVIERAYQAFFEADEARISRLPLDALAGKLDAAMLSQLGGADALELLAVELVPTRTNLPMLVCLLHVGPHSYAGYGLSANVDISLARAVSEAVQAYAVDISGSREDLDVKRPARRVSSARPSLSLDDYRARVIDCQFDTLGQELEHALNWVRAFGFPEVMAVNLSRVGIDIPVVKVVVPGLPCPQKLCQPREATPAVSEPTHHRYGLTPAAAVPSSRAGRPRVRVYGGLSVSEQQVKALLPDASFSMPAERGDVLRDLREGVDVIALIDGRFQQALAVSVAEIADALRCGVRIYGAASMGALRAVELTSLGMRGHGAIFDWVRQCRYFRDDYLGLFYSDERPELRGVAYVDVHFALAEMAADGRIDPAEAALLDERYRSLHFAERDLASLLDSMRAAGELTDARRLLAREAVGATSQKSRDAQSLLERVGAELRQLRLGNRELARSVAGSRRFPFLAQPGAPGLSMLL